MTRGLNVRILGYAESLERLRGIIPKFETQIKTAKDSSFLLPFISFYLALLAHKKALEYLNDKYLNYGLAWDEDIGLPSLPSLVADVGSYIRYLNPQGGLRMILESFCGWTLFAKEEIMCACGKRSLKLRKVSLEIMLAHILEIKNSSVVVKQLLGVRTDDMKHLVRHYNFKKPSQRIDNLFMIWLCQNRIKNNGNLEGEYLGSEQAEQFNLLGFQNRVLELTGKEEGNNESRCFGFAE